jgi:hypothetical protein
MRVIFRIIPHAAGFAYCSAKSHERSWEKEKSYHLTELYLFIFCECLTGLFYLHACISAVHTARIKKNTSMRLKRVEKCTNIHVATVYAMEQNY